MKFSHRCVIQLRAIHEEIYVVHAVLWSVNVFSFDKSINALLNHINHALY